MFLLKEFQLTLSNMHLHNIQGTVLAHIVFIKGLSISLIQKFQIHRYILKGKGASLYRPDLDSDTALLAVRGTVK